MQKEIPTAQNQNQVDIYHDLVEDYQVKTFIELGTFKGGLMLEMILNHPTLDIHSFEHDGSELHSLIQSHPQVYVRDIFLDETIKFISNIIKKSNGIVFLFCDNGNKIKEFWLYYPLLRDGDLIVVHDYPGEATPEFVLDVDRKCKDLEPIDREYFIECGIVGWRKVSPVIK